jgi:hypothetical protein
MDSWLASFQPSFVVVLAWPVSSFLFGEKLLFALLRKSPDFHDTNLAARLKLSGLRAVLSSK